MARDEHDGRDGESTYTLLEELEPRLLLSAATGQEQLLVLPPMAQAQFVQNAGHWGGLMGPFKAGGPGGILATAPGYVGVPLTAPNADGSIFGAYGPSPSEWRPRVVTNINAADTTNTDQLWSGGGLSLDLTGSGYTVAIWDKGPVLGSHDEFYDGSSRVTWKEPGGAPAAEDHSTHVAGTIGAEGDVSSAQGMATEVTLWSYDWGDDYTEMDTDAASIDVSNHSYSFLTGWTYDTLNGPNGVKEYGIWWSDRYLGAEDREFGKYTSNTQTLDDTIADNPDLLSVWSAGNDRNEDYSSKDSTWYVTYRSDYDPAGWYFVSLTDATHPAPGADGSHDSGFDTLPEQQTAKNTLVVGAIEDVTADAPYGTVTMTSFSSWGSTDDGRVKPDLVGNGYGVYSSVATADDAYDGTYSGTSMAAPNVSGTAVLLVEHYEDVFSSRSSPHAATTKAVMLHTANDQGNTGPDYKYGWGVADGAAAASLITAAGDGTSILTEQTYSGTELTYAVQSDGTDPVKVTVAWTDPAPASVPGSGLDVSTAVLVNDIDVWITGPGGTYYPWKLDVANPDTAATRTSAGNHVDNVEQVVIDSPSSGVYTIHIGRTGITFTQDFSMVADGVEQIVGIDATDATAAEASQATGTFTVSRDAVWAGAMAITYEHDSSSTATVNDYTTLSEIVTIAAGSSSATITLTPVDDLQIESSETVVIKLSTPTGSYTVDTSNASDTVTITDDDTLGVTTAWVTGVTADMSLHTHSLTDIDYTINGNGLSAGPAYTHNTTYTDAWLNHPDYDFIDAWMKFDLGDTYTLRGMHLWNFNQVGGGTVNGLATADIWVSTSSSPGTPDTNPSLWTKLADDTVLEEADGTSTYAGERYVLSEVGTPARYVFIDDLTNRDTGTYVEIGGISEIRFEYQGNDFEADLSTTSLPLTSFSGVIGTDTGSSSHVYADVDIYKVEVSSEGQLLAGVNNYSGSGMTIRVFDENGYEMYSSSDYDPKSNYDDAFFTYYVSSSNTGTHYVAISDDDNTFGSLSDMTYRVNTASEDSYTLDVRVIADLNGGTGAFADPIELEDRSTTWPAEVLSTTTYYEYIGDDPDSDSEDYIWADVDVYEVYLNDGERLLLTVSDSNSDSYLLLFDSPTGSYIAYTDSSLDFEVETSGTYYIGVSDNYNVYYSLDAGGNRSDNDEMYFSYTLTIDIVVDEDGYVSQSHDQYYMDPSDTDYAYGYLGQDDTYSDRVFADVDLFEFSLSDDGTFAVGCNDYSGSSMIIRLFDSSYNEITPDTTSHGSYADAYMGKYLSSGGTYYIGVSEGSNASYALDDSDASSRYDNEEDGSYSLYIELVSI